MSHQESELSQLKDQILTMASLAEQAVTSAVRALVDQNEDLATRVKNSDAALDNLEMAVDESAVFQLSKAPLARDLRFIVVAMKLSHDLERIGDEAAGIARQALKLFAEPPLKPYIDIPRMAEMAVSMLRDSIQSFVGNNTDLARSVLIRDRDVNDLHKQLQRELVSYMVESPPNITRCLALLQIAKRIERVADHAKNIAEEAVYLYEGRDIRHGKWRNFN